MKTVVSMSPLLRIRSNTRSGAAVSEILTSDCWVIRHGRILPLLLYVCTSGVALLVHSSAVVKNKYKIMCLQGSLEEGGLVISYSSSIRLEIRACRASSCPVWFTAVTTGDTSHLTVFGIVQAGTLAALGFLTAVAFRCVPCFGIGSTAWC